MKIDDLTIAVITLERKKAKKPADRRGSRMRHSGKRVFLLSAGPTINHGELINAAVKWQYKLQWLSMLSTSTRPLGLA
eukprot:scaffold34506_cov31-Tisochrysis_lutea.AAC.4